MSFGGATIDTSWLAGLGPTGTTTTSRIINAGGKILVVGNTSGDFTIQGFQVRGSGAGGQFVICFDTAGVVQWVQSPVVGLPVPTSVTAAAGDTTATVSWSSVATSLLTGYQVDVSGAGLYNVSGGTTATIDISGLTNKTVYPVRVRGVNATTQSDYSSSVTVRPMPVPPTPIEVSIASGARLIDITWAVTNTTFVDGYTVDVNGVTYDVPSGETLTYRVTGLSNYTLYNVKVRAYNTAFNSSYSPIQGVTLLPPPMTYKSISADSGESTIALMSDGTLRTWGKGANGRLGVGSTIDMSSAVTPCNISDAVSVTTGYFGACGAILSDGTVRTWGANSFYGVGIGSIIDMSRAVTPCNLSNVVSLSLGYGPNLALLSDGTVRTWGQGSIRLGLGAVAGDVTTPTTTCNISNAVAASLSQHHGVVLISDGTVRVWGSGGQGNGLGGIYDISRAMTACNISNAVAVTTGFNYSCGALLSDGTVRVWGYGLNGRLGTNGAGNQNSPVTACNLSNVVAIAMGDSHSAAVIADGSMRIWGDNTNGRLGTGNTTQQLTPVTPCNVSNVVAVTCGYTHTAVLLADGTMRTWGAGTNGRLGNANTTQQNSAITPCNISNVAIIKPSIGLSAVTSVTIGYDTLYAALMDISNTYLPGLIPYRGIAVTGTTGTWSYSTDSGTNWTAFPAVSASSALALRGLTTIRLKSSAAGDTLTVKAWSAQQATPAAVTSGVDTTVATATIQGYSFGATSTVFTKATAPVLAAPTFTAVGGAGIVTVTVTSSLPRYGIGYIAEIAGVQYTMTGSSQTIRNITDLGSVAVRVAVATFDGASTFSSVSNVTVMAPAPTIYRSITVANTHVATVLANGTMRTWGVGGNGQLGIGSTIDMSSAVTPLNISNVVAVSAGGSHTAALLADGTMRIWGFGGSGRLGIGSTTQQSTAVTPCNISNIVAVFAGRDHTTALIDDGTMRTWGDGANGKLGIGSTTNQTTAVTPCNISNVVAVTAGAYHTAALLADGTMRTWGYGPFGQLGIGSTIDMSRAVTPCNLSNVVAISVGDSTTAALLADGTMRIWGEGGSGQLGIGSTTQQTTAVTPCNISNVVAISLATEHTAALLADGTMRTWGFGGFGRLGVGSTTTQSTAVTPCNISNVVAISAGSLNTAALLADGTMRIWGVGSNGQLGIGSKIDMSRAVTPCNISSVSIVKPSIARSAFSSVPIGALSLYAAMMDISAMYQPGTVPYRGIAVVGTTGSWSYSTNGGTSWTAFPAVSASSALALECDASIRLRASVGDTITVKAWSAQQATPALITSGIDTTVSTATIQGFSFSTNTSVITRAAIPAPVAPSVTVVGGFGTINVTVTTAPLYAESYIYEIGGVQYTSTATGYNMINQLPGIYAVRVAAVNVDGVTGTYSSTTNVTVIEQTPVTYTSIAEGGALLSDGTMRVWGGGANGALGIGSTIDMSLAVTPCNISNVISIGGKSCALLADGTVRLWGENTNGQLGIGTLVDMSLVVTPCNLSNVIAVSTGINFRCALLADGTVRTWGRNNNGQLGVGTSVDMSRAVTPCNVRNVVTISTGEHTCVLLADGTMRTWGTGASGQLGVGSAVTLSTAVTPCNISNIVAIAAGTSNTCALLADGTMRVWGAGSNGALGTGNATQQNTPVTPCNISNVVAIASGTWNMFALLADGTMRAWGNNSQGRLGIGSTTSQTTAVTPCNISNIVSIGANSTTYALVADGTMRVWGANLSGQLGTGTTVSQLTAVTPCNISNVAIVKPSIRTATQTLRGDSLFSQVMDISNLYQPGVVGDRGFAIVGATGSWEYTVDSGATWTALGAVSASSATLIQATSAAGLRPAVLGNTLTVKAWNCMQATPAAVTVGADTTVTGTGYAAYSFSDSTAVIDSTNSALATPVIGAVGGSEIVDISFAAISRATSYIVSIGSTQYTVTSNISRLTGIAGGTYSVTVTAANLSFNSVASNSVNVTVLPAAPTTYRSISMNMSSAYVISDGTIRMCGYGGAGALGIGSTIDMSRAVTPCNLSNVMSISSGWGMSVALLNDGTVRTWGSGGSGALGIGSTIDMSRAVTPCNLSNVVAIDHVSQHTCALLKDGTLRIWGLGTNGRLGTGNTTQQNTPVTPCNVSNVVAIATEYLATFALISDGTVRAWGDNTYGKLGIGSLTGSQLTAVTPCNLSNVVSISIKANTALALLSDGTVRAWGYGANRQLGISSAIDRSSPITPCNLSNVIAVSGGTQSMCALIADGTMRVWGLGGSGQLGIGSTVDMSLAVTPCNLSNIVAISGGAGNNGALLADGTMRIWGSNFYGQLGNGLTTTASQLTPVTPCNISSIAIVKPSFKTNLTTVINHDLSHNYFLQINTGYQPGTVPYRGIAITATTGTWEYSTNTGSSWNAVPAVTESSALALRLQPTVRIRCTAAGVLTVKAWSAQQATPATATTGVDTTVATATIQGYSFAAAETTITAA